MLCLLVVAAMTGLSPVSSLAAEYLAADSTVEMPHLNQATAEQLQSLLGIGPALSERIVLNRTEHGPFRTADSFAEVLGVGQAKLAFFKKQLTVESTIAKGLPCDRLFLVAKRPSFVASLRDAYVYYEDVCEKP
jgi:competence ComEA-like helix-hairpin-helix protein